MNEIELQLIVNLLRDCADYSVSGLRKYLDWLSEIANHHKFQELPKIIRAVRGLKAL